MTSIKNVIERFWPELNSRVNYLVKRTLISIIYWREWLQYARFLVQWGFIPIKNMRLSQQNALLNKVFVPSTFEAFKMYEELGGNLSRNSSFGWDRLVMNEEAYEHRLRSFLANQPTGEAIFADVVRGYNKTLKISIEYF